MLTNKQKAFVEFYLKHWNATKAAELAGYSKRTANEQGSRLLANVSVETAIKARLDELKMGADEVLTRLADHARGSLEYFLAGNSLSIAAAREHGKLHLAKKIKQTTRSSDDEHLYTTLEVELHDPQAALVQLGRHHKLFVERHELTGKDGGPLEVRAFDYATAIAPIAAGPEPDSEAPGEGEGDRDGAALGEDADGG